MKNSAEVDAEVEKMRTLRREMLDKLDDICATAVSHIENGSFEFVEEALVDCRAGLCEIQETIRKNKNKRRARKGSGGGAHERTAAAGQAG